MYASTTITFVFRGHVMDSHRLAKASVAEIYPISMRGSAALNDKKSNHHGTAYSFL